MDPILNATTPILYVFNSIKTNTYMYIDKDTEDFNNNKNECKARIVSEFQEVQKEINTNPNYKNLSPDELEKINKINQLFTNFIASPNFKIFTELKEYNSSNIAPIIPSKELDFQLQKIKMAIHVRGWASSFLYKMYGIWEDEKRIFEIIKTAASVDGGEVARTIKGYGISMDQNMLFEIAKIAAAAYRSYGNDFSKYIKEFDIKDPIMLFEIAKIAAAKEGRGTSEFIKNYGINDTKMLFEIAKIAAAKDGRGTSEFIKNYEIQDLTMHFEIAKIAAAQNGWAVSYCIKKYNIQDQEKRLVVAQIALNQMLDKLLEQTDPVIPKEICGVHTNFLNIMGLQLMQNPNRLLLPAEKEVLGSLAPIEETSTTGNSFETERIIRKRTILHRWLGYYLLKHYLWLAKSKVKPTSSFELTFKRKAVSDLIEKGQHERLNKKERKALSKCEQLDFYPLLKAVSKLHNPPMRYKLTQLLYNQLYFAENISPLEIYSQLGKEKGFDTTDRGIFRLLLTTLIYAQDKNRDYSNCMPVFKEWETVLSTLSEASYKEVTVQMSIINALYALIEETELTGKEKSDLVRGIFSLAQEAASSKQKASIIIREFRLLETIIATKKFKELKEMLLQMQELKTPFTSLQEIIKSLFKNIIGEIDVKEFSEKFEKTFLAARQPLAFITYATKLSDKPEMVPYLKAFFIDVLEGNTRNSRYKSVKNDHLDTVFSWKKNPEEKAAWEHIWKIGCSKPLDSTPTETDEKLHKEKELDIQKILFEKICTDKHIELKEYPIIAQYLQNPQEFGIVGALKRLSNLEEQYNKENKDTTEADIKKLYLQKYLIALCDSRNNSEKKEVSLETAITYMESIYPRQNDHAFLLDLKAIEKRMHEKGRVSLSGWTVEDSDHWEDLLLCGTEVLGSCQSIHNSSVYNKCLMNYILDGKNRVVVLKDAEGHIQARVLLRLLWNPVLKQPVLFRERLYCATGIIDGMDKYISQIDSMCLNKAKALGISLVTEYTKEKSTVYKQALESLNSRAPYEYVDASSIGITGGKFTLPAKGFQLVTS